MENKRIVILYGSETGTAQDLAELIWRETKIYNIEGPVLAMNEYDIRRLIEEEIVIFVCSTTGQGQEPDNMKTFWKFLLRKSLPSNSLEGLNFAVLGLGDSSYPKFNFVSKRLYKRLLNLSAKPLVPLGLCDDQHDLGPSAIYFSWIKNLLNCLEKLYSLVKHTDKSSLKFIPRWSVDETTENKNITKNIDALKKPTIENCIQIYVQDNIRTTSLEHFQDVRLLSFNPNGEIWDPGNVLVVKPWNDEKDIELLFDIFKECNLKWNKSTIISVTEKFHGMYA